MNDRWLMSASGAVPVGRARITARRPRTRGSTASSPASSATPSRIRGARPAAAQADATLARGFDASAGVELLGERAGSTFITATGNVLVPVERGIAGFFGEGALEPRRAALRHRRAPRRAHHPRGARRRCRRVLAAAAVRRATPSSRRTRKSSAAWFLGVDRRQLHQGARLGRHRHPAARRVRDRVHRQPVAQARAQPSFEAGVEQALFGGRGLVEATVFFNNYDDLIVAAGSFSGSSQYRTDNISNARARGLELAGTARAPLSGLRGGSLQLRVGYTRLDTEILAVDRERRRAAAVRGRRSAAAPARRTSSRPTSLVRRRAGCRHSSQGGGRSSARDIDPSFGTFGGLFDGAGLQRLERRRVVDAVERPAGLRPRHQPLRPRLRGSARLPGARPACDGGAQRCCEPLTSRSRYHAHGAPVAARRVARRAGRRLRRHPRAERIGQDDAAAAAGRHAAAARAAG